MDNLDDSENNAKISDSAYSNSCSNSQSRRSRSSKSTHSGSNSSGSGSSGYGGKPSTSGSSNALDQPSKKDKESKKKKQSKSEANAVQKSAVVECRPPEPIPLAEPKEEKKDVIETPTVLCPPPEQAAEDMDIVTSENGTVKNEAMDTTMRSLTSECVASGHINILSNGSDGFSCVISMHDGVVRYTTSNLTTTLGFPKDMWIGRSFIDFVHPRDRSTFASQITNGLAVPKIVNGTQEKAQNSDDATSTLVCRIRKYRGLASGFGVKDRVVTFMPFLLKFTFKNVNDEEGKSIYLVMQATPYYSAFKVPNEVFTKPSMFVMRHDAKGHIEYIEPESVPYLGFMPQEIQDKNALKLYHPEDLPYIRQIYETIVKEGNVVKSKSFRMMVQNGDYVKMETEWSSFINPWSLKLEFVIGKHHIIKGPENPDVFESPDPEKALKLSEEEKNKAEGLRESIVRIMNEVLTKPAEAAKQQMNKRCQDIALFMERLIENQPKADDDLRIDIQDPEYSYYERDSVMLGGISPHHEYNDSKSSTETPLSYNQLNYNENLQRYFDSHQPYCYEDYNTVDGENILGLNKNTQLFSGNCPSPSAQPLGDSTDVASSGDSSAAFMVDSTPPNTASRNCPSLTLTEPLLKKHNADMEKELVKMHRESRCCTKGERKKASDETRQKKKAHLARCNATFQPTLPVTTTPTATEGQAHGVKRLSKSIESQMNMNKHHCSSSRQLRQRQPTSTAPAQTSTTYTTTVANWPPPPPVNSMNTFIVGVGIPQQMSIMNPLSAMSPMTGVFPMYYTPASTGPSTSAATANPSCTTTSFAQPAMPCMMYGQPVYGQPIMYTPVNTQVSYPMQQTMMAQAMQFSNNLNPFGLNNNNYEQACKSTLPPGGIKPVPPSWRETKRADAQTKSAKVKHGNPETSKALKREVAAHESQTTQMDTPNNSSDVLTPPNSLSLKSTEAVPGTSAERDYKAKTPSYEDTVVDRTDGESSYSSFYSSFFKTESGSADDSGGDRKRANPENTASGSNVQPQEPKKIVRRKIEPPWMEQVCVTSELIYKYQILTKSMDEVLLSDREKMKKMEQPALVNEQLGQLYMDMQLEGVATRLTLEEGITSSSSSGEDTCSKSDKDNRRKRKYNKLSMIYEEDAPMPPPDDVPESSPSPSTASLY